MNGGEENQGAAGGKNHIYNSRTDKTTDVWLTPPELIRSLGEFDLDPAAASHRPWPTAKAHFTVQDDGLSKVWAGRVWLNPPYGREVGLWLEKLRQHGDGIALVTPRTETKWYFEHVWGRADAIFFFRGRLRFHHEDGTPGGTSTTPSCLVAYGQQNVRAILRSGLDGCLVKSMHLMIVDQGLN